MDTNKAIKNIGKVICHAPDSESNEYYWNERDKFKWMITFFFGNMLIYSCRVVMAICVPAISKELGWNKEVSGLVLSSFFFGYLLTNMLGGYLADRFGGEIVICVTGIGWASLTIIIPYLTHFGTNAVIFSRFLTGLCQGVFYPSMSAIMAKHVAVAKKGVFAGVTNSGSDIGNTATGFFGSIILEKFNWSVAFIIIGTLSLLWTLWLRYLISYRNMKYYKKVDAELKEPLPVLKLIRSGPFWGLYIAFFCASYCFHNFVSWSPVYFHDTFPESKGWLFNTIPWLVSFSFSNISGYASNRLITNGYSITFVRKLYATILFLGYCVCSITINYVTSFNEALFIMSINIGVNAFSNCSLAMNSQDLAPNHAGALHGFMNGMGALAGVSGVYLTGYILETTGHWTSAFLTISGSAFIGLIFFLLLSSGKKVV